MNLECFSVSVFQESFFLEYPRKNWFYKTVFLQKKQFFEKKRFFQEKLFFTKKKVFPVFVVESSDGRDNTSTIFQNRGSNFEPTKCLVFMPEIASTIYFPSVGCKMISSFS